MADDFLPTSVLNYMLFTDMCNF